MTEGLVGFMDMAEGWRAVKKMGGSLEIINVKAISGRAFRA